MNRYLLFFMLVGLQANIALSNQLRDFFNSAFRYFKPATAYAFGGGNVQSNPAGVQPIRERQTHLPEELKKEIFMDRLVSHHKYPKETMAVINEVEKKIHHYAGNNLDEEQRNNMNRFNDICSEHIIKSMGKLSHINNETIKKMPDEELATCTIALVNAQRTSSDLRSIPHLLAHVLKGPIENDIFKKMAKGCKDRRKVLKFVRSKGYPMQTFKDNFDRVAYINDLPISEKAMAYALRDGCGKYMQYFLRGNPYTQKRFSKAYNEAIKCVATSAEILEEGRGEQQAQEASQKVYNAFDSKNPTGDISYLFRGPGINAESIKKTIKACKQDLVNKQNKNREE